MANESPAKIEDVIANKIRAQFVELLPENTFKEMVEKALKDFTQKTGYQNNSASPLEKLIEQELRDRFLRQVKAEFDKPEHLVHWGHNSQTPSIFVKEIISQLTPQIMEAFFGSMIQQAVSTLRNQISTIR